MTSALGGQPTINLTATGTAPAKSAGINITKNAADTEDGEDLGFINFIGEDEGNNLTTFAQILAEIEESDETDEAGKLSLTVATSDGTSTGLQNAFTATGQATDNYISTTIGYGAASTTTIAGTLTMGSTAAMTNAGALSVAAQPNITTMTGFLGGTANALVTDDGDGTVTSEAGPYLRFRGFNYW